MSIGLLMEKIISQRVICTLKFPQLCICNTTIPTNLCINCMFCYIYQTNAYQITYKSRTNTNNLKLINPEEKIISSSANHAQLELKRRKNLISLFFSHFKTLSFQYEYFINRFSTFCFTFIKPSCNRSILKISSRINK